MNLAEILRRKPKQLDGAAVEGDGSAAALNEFGDLQANDTARRKQILLLSAGGALALVAGSMWIFSGSEAEDEKAEDGAVETVSAGDMVNRNMSEKEWMAASEGRFQSIDNQLKAVDGQAAAMERLQAQLAAVQGENQSMASDGQRVVSAYQSENDQLRSQLAAAKAAPVAAPPPPGPSAMYGARGAPSYTPAAGAPGSTPQGAAAMAASRGIKMVSFEGGSAGNGTRIAGGATQYTDSPNYLPPNSIAKAKVIVGVDASAGVNSQSDPLPVVLRITGPARSVYRDGKLLTTQIQGCLVNGAARGDLSSEKVYVKLQRMTCPQANGRYAVSDVKGFIAFAGKTGVRGRVVSREGSLASQAFFAGLVSSAGAALNSAFEAPIATIGTGANGSVDHTPKLGNVGLRGLGGGAEQAGKNVSQYLIERAEQYQPVIEMPTGIDVEIVFLEGVFIQN